jgi:hypothetical protein
VAGRFCRSTATAADVLEACRMFERANAEALKLREKETP